MQFTSLILSNAEVSPGYWRMRMTAPPELASARPGQFVMVRINGAIEVQTCSMCWGRSARGLIWELRMRKS